MPEIIRQIIALQTTDKFKVSTPAHWQFGGKIVVPPPKTTAELEKRKAERYECKDWYLCFQKI
jgi:peroxiredoxin (alkyl hydroperoxide reductase subunit C)